MRNGSGKGFFYLELDGNGWEKKEESETKLAVRGEGKNLVFVPLHN